MTHMLDMWRTIGYLWHCWAQIHAWISVNTPSGSGGGWMCG